MVKGVLKRIWSAHNNLRTGRVYGEAIALPRVGSSLMLAADPLNEAADFRFVTTTPVIYTEEIAPGYHRFFTKNSVYEFEVYKGVTNDERSEPARWRPSESAETGTDDGDGGA